MRHFTKGHVLRNASLGDSAMRTSWRACLQTQMVEPPAVIVCAVLLHDWQCSRFVYTSITNMLGWMRSHRATGIFWLHYNLMGNVVMRPMTENLFLVLLLRIALELILGATFRTCSIFLLTTPVAVHFWLLRMDLIWGKSRKPFWVEWSRRVIEMCLCLHPVPMCVWAVSPHTTEQFSNSIQLSSDTTYLETASGPTGEGAVLQDYPSSTWCQWLVQVVPLLLTYQLIRGSSDPLFGFN